MFAILRRSNKILADTKVFRALAETAKTNFSSKVRLSFFERLKLLYLWHGTVFNYLLIIFRINKCQCSTVITNESAPFIEQQKFCFDEYWCFLDSSSLPQKNIFWNTAHWHCPPGQLFWSDKRMGQAPRFWRGRYLEYRWHACYNAATGEKM